MGLGETKQQDLGVDWGCGKRPSSGILFLGKLQILLQEILGPAAARSSLGSLGGRRDPAEEFAVSNRKTSSEVEWGKMGEGWGI